MPFLALVLLVPVSSPLCLDAVERPETIDPQKQRTAQQPKLTRSPHTSYEFSGFLDEYLKSVSNNWLKVAPGRNPAMLDMFADRDRWPRRGLMPWSGEFAGKHLTGAVQVLRLTGDKELKDHLQAFVKRLVRLQAEDGYLGPWPKEYQFSGKGPDVIFDLTWDAWNHYHIMMGLLLWHEQTQDAQALASVEKIGDLLCNTFLDNPRTMASMGWPETNLAPVHALCLLYKTSGKPRYLELARQIIVKEFPAGGDYVRTALAGKEFYQTPKPRWESLHPIMSIVEMYWITGDENYRRAFEHIWWSIVKFDRHNTGGFSSGEEAAGSPYNSGSIETCCTIAWSALSVEMLRLTGNSIVADELELSFMNAVLGYEPRSGSWCTYNTPMNGKRMPFILENPAQEAPGSLELTCCTVNAPRGFGLISDWALMTDSEGLALNWYGPSTIDTEFNRIPVTLRQRTDYPRTGRIVLEVSPSKAINFALKLRIPHWSKNTSIVLNSKPVENIFPGSYLTINREWQPGDTIHIDLDMSLHYWLGENECEGKTSIYRGPILLAYTRRLPQMAAINRNWKQLGDLYRCNSPISSATLEYYFEGDRVRWFGRRFDDAGMAKIKIDGKDVAIVDQYGPGRDTPFHWEHKGLGQGRHKLELIILSDRNESSKGNWVNIYEFSPFEQELVLDAANMNYRLLDADNTDDAIVKLEIVDAHGNKVNLSDFDSAGEDWKSYVSWLKVTNVPKSPFAISNPLRSGR
jgi:DUF1680 family protein